MSEGELRQQAAKIFQDAARYIRTYGWQVSGMGEHGKPRCSMGALASVGPRGRWNPELAHLMYKVLYDELGGMGLTQFNHLHQNGESVARLFEDVAARLVHAKTPAMAQYTYG